jgi:hypothetical protein
VADAAIHLAEVVIAVPREVLQRGIPDRVHRVRPDAIGKPTPARATRFTFGHERLLVGAVAQAGSDPASEADHDWCSRSRRLASTARRNASGSPRRCVRFSSSRVCSFAEGSGSSMS